MTATSEEGSDAGSRDKMLDHDDIIGHIFDALDVLSIANVATGGW